MAKGRSVGKLCSCKHNMTAEYSMMNTPAPGTADCASVLVYIEAQVEQVTPTDIVNRPGSLLEGTVAAYLAASLLARRQLCDSRS